MITTSHIIYGWAAARASEQSPNPKRTSAFIIGSFLPDTAVYAFFIVHGLLLGTSQQIMWDELYFDSAWTPFFTLSHSLLLWPALLLLGTCLKQQTLKYVAAAGTLHVVLDFFVHNVDAYRHFWPLSDWKFVSPVSYWDPEHYGRLVGALDSVVVLGLLVWLYTRYQQKRARVGIGLIAVLYVASLVLPFIIF